MGYLDIKKKLLSKQREPRTRREHITHHGQQVYSHPRRSLNETQQYKAIKLHYYYLVPSRNFNEMTIHYTIWNDMSPNGIHCEMIMQRATVWNCRSVCPLHLLCLVAFCPNQNLTIVHFYLTMNQTLAFSYDLHNKPWSQWQCFQRTKLLSERHNTIDGIEYNAKTI